MGEVYGWVSGRTLLGVAKHADKVDDYVTVLRCREIAARGVEVGWSEDSPDDGKIVPNRTRAQALKEIPRVGERC